MTWDELLARLGIEWCPACHTYNELHDNGFYVGGMMHWRDRRYTRPGAHKLLRKIVVGRDPMTGLPAWRRIYLTNSEVLDLAKRARIRLPRSVFDLDRARLRYALSEYTVADRRRMTPSEQRDFRAAVRWAARS